MIIPLHLLRNPQSLKNQKYQQCETQQGHYGASGTKIAQRQHKYKIINSKPKEHINFASILHIKTSFKSPFYNHKHNPQKTHQKSNNIANSISLFKYIQKHSKLSKNRQNNKCIFTLLQSICIPKMIYINLIYQRKAQ